MPAERLRLGTPQIKAQRRTPVLAARTKPYPAGQALPILRSSLQHKRGKLGTLDGYLRMLKERPGAYRFLENRFVFSCPGQAALGSRP
jgi:hypothetical protein